MKLPSALRCLSYLINNFLTDIKQLAKTSGVSREEALSVPFLMSISEASSVLFHCNKSSAIQKLLSDQAWSLVPKLNLLQRS